MIVWRRCGRCGERDVAVEVSGPGYEPNIEAIFACRTCYWHPEIELTREEQQMWEWRILSDYATEIHEARARREI